MEDFPILLISLIVYLIAASSGNKKKKRRERTRRSRSPMRTAAQGEQHDRVSNARSSQTQKGFAEVFAQAEHQENCETKPVHLHDVSQLQMASAAEGEDPCHAGGVSMKHEGMPDNPADNDNVLAQEVLRGVIMSEILTRPQERAAWRRNRRGYHG